MLRDRDIRKELTGNVLPGMIGGVDTVIVPELPVCMGEARVDLAVINCSLHGYEIKSERDTLQRLSNQVECYGRVLDYVTMVSTGKHIQKMLEHDLLPEWWGIMDFKADCEIVRPAQQNPDQDPYSVAQLLWREEALGELERLGLERGVKSKPRKEIWKRLAESLSLDELLSTVKRTLKARLGEWRADLLLPSGDGS